MTKLFQSNLLQSTIIWSFVALLSLAACKQQTAGTPALPDTSFKLIDVATAKQMIAKDSEIVILDVRTLEEIAEGKLSAQALELDYHSDDFKSKLDKLDKNKPYLVYCRSGGRSAKTLEMMKKLSFRDCSDLDGGYTAWKKAH